ncbi:hypothetical protein [Terasakiella sp.]|uniref:hypothetical protein n=1 Tax=Terasakiella sp. TaxID=2034861 RepID=UPI003AA80291
MSKKTYGYVEHAKVAKTEGATIQKEWEELSEAKLVYLLQSVEQHIAEEMLAILVALKENHITHPQVGLYTRPEEGG